MVPRLVLFVSLFDGVVTAVVPSSHNLSCTYPKVLFTVVSTLVVYQFPYRQIEITIPLLPKKITQAKHN